MSVEPTTIAPKDWDGDADKWEAWQKHVAALDPADISLCSECKSLHISYDVSFYPNAPKDEQVGEDTGGNSWCYDCEEDGEGNGEFKYSTSVGDLVLGAIRHGGPEVAVIFTSLFSAEWSFMFFLRACP